MFNPNIFWGQQTGQGKVSIIIDIRTNMPVCAFTCRYPATYISCSQAEAVNTKRRLLHSYETHPATLSDTMNPMEFIDWLLSRLTALCFGFVSLWFYGH